MVSTVEFMVWSLLDKKPTSRYVFGLKKPDAVRSSGLIVGFVGSTSRQIARHLAEQEL
jgi:hypothetical protein